MIQSAVAPLVVTLLNYSFALPGYVYLNAVGGTGKTKITFIFQAIATGIYLIYLYGLNNSTNTTLTLYLTAEYLFVILLALQSIVYLKRNTIKKQMKEKYGVDFDLENISSYRRQTNGIPTRKLCKRIDTMAIKDYPKVSMTA